MKRCLLIINPSSGQRTIQNSLDKLTGQLILQQLVNHIDVFYTQKKDDAYNHVLNVDEKNYDFIIVVGGDGTINEVVSGMVSTNKKIPLCILAAGTVNDFANYLNLPNQVDKVCAMIKQFKTLCLDVGKINDRYFMNVAAGGMFSDVSFTVSKADKKRLGPLAYYINGIANLPSQLNTNIDLKVVIDNYETKEFEAKMFMVSNTNRVGGYLLHKHAKSPFIFYTQAKKITISTKQELVIDIDGEEGSPLPVTIEVVPQALNILIP